jgi:broad specificity phosphatase PhoE
MPEGAVDVHLIRPGETRSYAADVGLTARGEGQCRRRGMHVAEELGDGEHVRLLWAPSVRSARTADEVRSGLEEGLAATGRRATVGDPEPAPWFRNFDVWAPTGPREPTQAWREYEATLRAGRAHEAPGPTPIWLLEMDRFWQMESDRDDPIGLWMTVPLLTFEPPASVLQRVWTGLLELARSDRPGDHAVCCTHSGPMRAFSKSVFGDDVGDPGNCEELRVRLDPPFVGASVMFRGLTRRVPVPQVDGAPPAPWPHS